MDTRNLIGGFVIFAAFFWTPTMSAYLLRKYKLKVLGEELLPFGLPIIAGVGLYAKDWSIATLGIAASAGYFLGLWYVRNKGKTVASFSYYTLTPESARDTPTDLLVKAMNDCRPDSGAYLAAKTELQRRADVQKNWRKVGIAVVIGLIGLALWSLRG